MEAMMTLDLQSSSKKNEGGRKRMAFRIGIVQPSHPQESLDRGSPSSVGPLKVDSAESPPRAINR